MAAMLLLMTCGLASASAEDGGKVVRDRAVAHWSAIVDGKYDEAYRYTSPGFREKVNLMGYIARFIGKVKYQKATVDELDCDGDVCTLKVDVEFFVFAPPPMRGGILRTAKLTEKWIRLDNDWWFVPKR